MHSLPLEIRYACRERTVVAALVIVFLISAYAVTNGALEVASQQSQIETLAQAAETDRRYALGTQSDAGGAAYYVHHVTYGPPTVLAFAALGTRVDLPWQHRLRMLALEGQIYEADTGNPELTLLGRLDFAFVVSVLLPLILILLLYDLNARERREGRYELLSATSTAGHYTLLIRASALTMLLFGAAITPFVAMALFSAAAFTKSLMVLLTVGLHLAFWLCICRFVTVRCTEAPTAVTVLLAAWLLVTSAIPAMGKVLVEAYVPVPAGGEILLAQREAVNDAWDLPKDATMAPFVVSHPQWRAYSQVDQPFEWKWYYAFQQMGDELVRPQSDALQKGIMQRDSLMGWVSVLSPPLAAERWLIRLAETDRAHHHQYMLCVRAFHAALREFHYPMLFGTAAYSAEAMADLPQYDYCDAQEHQGQPAANSGQVESSDG